MKSDIARPDPIILYWRIYFMIFINKRGGKVKLITRAVKRSKF